MKRASLIITAVVLSCGSASLSLAQNLPRREIVNVTGDLYRATNNNHNTFLLVTPQGAVIGDPISPEFAQWLRDEIRSRFDVDVEYVVYSHHHGDHASGGAVFADTAVFVGHENMHDYLAMPPESTQLTDVVGQYAPVAALDANNNGTIERAEASGNVSDDAFGRFDGNGDGVLSGAEVMRGPVSGVYPPTITYSEEMTIQLGGQRVHLTWAGEFNHSFDLSRITFPDENVMFLVDYVTFGRLPYREMDFENGMYPEWMALIRETEALAQSYDYVLTGHGSLGGPENVTEWRIYFEQLEAAVSEAIADGQSLEEMRADIRIPDYEHWTGYDWLHENVLAMYHFLTD